MKQVIRSNERYTAEHGWLTTSHSFSFANYYDPQNMNFGQLRVFNDDIIEPGEGFGMHPHRDMEIMTYVIEGTLEHQDSMGNKGTLVAGEVQRMTAGTGVYHSEYNHSTTEHVHMLQIWFMTDQRNRTPSWEQRQFTKTEQQNRLLLVVSGDSAQTEALTIYQDVKVYLTNLAAGTEIHHETDYPKMYVFVIDGKILLQNEHELFAGDSVRISDETVLTMYTNDGAHVMVMDLT